MNLNCGIYKIINILTGDFYIGQSINLVKRKRDHFFDLEHQKHKNSHIQNAYNKYGKENFKFEILLICEPFELTRYEQGLVDRLKPQYNINLECVNSSKGRKASNQAIINNSNAQKGKVLSEETKIKMSIARKGKTHSPEWSKKISESQKGKTRSKESVEKMRNTKKGIKLTEEHKRKISEGNKGKIVSEETRRKISESHIGITHTIETKLKISILKKGKKLPERTEEYKKKRSELKKLWWKNKKGEQLG